MAHISPFSFTPYLMAWPGKPVCYRLDLVLYILTRPANPRLFRFCLARTILVISLNTIHLLQTFSVTPRALLIRDLDTFPQPFNNQLLARAAMVDILDVICGGLEVAGGVVALGDEDVVGLAVLDRLVERNGFALRDELAKAPDR